MDINSCSFTGHLAADCEVKYFDSGTAIVKFRIAVNRPPDSRGQEQKPTWVNVKHWIKPESKLPVYLVRGARVGVAHGELLQERWIDRNSGEERSKYVIEARQVVLLGSKSNTSATDTPAPTYAGEPLGTGWDGEF